MCSKCGGIQKQKIFRTFLFAFGGGGVVSLQIFTTIRRITFPGI